MSSLILLLGLQKIIKRLTTLLSSILPPSKTAWDALNVFTHCNEDALISSRLKLY